MEMYRQVSNIKRTKSQHLKDSRTVLRLSLPNPLKPDEVENEDVVGAAPTGDAPTTSEWSTILLPTRVRLILKTLRYTQICCMKKQSCESFFCISHIECKIAEAKISRQFFKEIWEYSW